MLGLEAVEGEAGDQFVNTNSVANIDEDKKEEDGV